MGTKAKIAMKDENSDQYTCIQLYWDGYPKNAGRQLLAYYTDPVQIKKLIALGDINGIDSVPGVRAYDPQSVLQYGSKRVDGLEALRVFARDSYCAWAYAFDGERWLATELPGSDDNWMPLKRLMYSLEIPLGETA